MTNFENILSELKLLQERFTAVSNELWSLRTKKEAFLRQGEDENCFLLKRFNSLETEKTIEFGSLFSQLQSLLDKKLSEKMFLINSVNDVKNIQLIAQTISYIKNAFSADLPLIQTLARLKLAIAKN